MCWTQKVLIPMWRLRPLGMCPSQNFFYFHPTRLYQSLSWRPTTPIPNPHPPTDLVIPMGNHKMLPVPLTPLPSVKHPHPAPIRHSSIPFHTSSSSTNGGRDTNARVRSTLHCSPDKRDVNRRGANFAGFLAYENNPLLLGCKQDVYVVDLPVLSPW